MFLHPEWFFPSCNIWLRIFFFFHFLKDILSPGLFLANFWINLEETSDFFLKIQALANFLGFKGSILKFRLNNGFKGCKVSRHPG